MSKKMMFLLSSLIIVIISLSLTSCPVPTQNTLSQQVAAPTFKPASGTYASAQLVNISSTTSGSAIIRYTTDGSTPTSSNGTLYTAPISVGTSQTIKAIAYESGWTDSAMATGAYTITGSVAAPTFSPVAGTYSSDQSVAINCTTPGAAIHYTTDGSTPTVSSTLYSAAIPVAGNGTNETIKAIAIKTGMANSLVASSAYTINYSQVSTLTFSPVAGTYTTDQSVAISCTTPGATIHYTTDGSAPTGASTLFATPISVASNGTNETIKAIAIKTGMANSTVGAATYIISYLPVSTPTFSPLGGTYTNDQSVAINCETSGATIHFTTDNSTPSSSSPTYTTPIAVFGNGTTTTIKAYGIKTGMLDSSVETATYTIYNTWHTYNLGNAPAGIAVDTNGRIYVVPVSFGIVRMDDMNGTNLTLFGSSGSGTNQFFNPSGIAVDPSGHIYIADTVNGRIVRMNDMSGTNWTTFGTRGRGTNQFFDPSGIAVDASGHIYVADLSNCRIVRMDDMNGTNWTTFGTIGSGTNQFSYPAGVALDASGHIYIADRINQRIVRMDDMNGTNWTTFGTLGSGTNQFFNPSGIAVDASGHIYIADRNNQRIVRMDDMNGTNWTTFGTLGSGGINQFYSTAAVAVDASGHIYVCDEYNRIVCFMMP